MIDFIDSNHLTYIILLSFSIAYSISLGKFCFSRHLSVSSYLLDLLAEVVHNVLLKESKSGSQTNIKIKIKPNYSSYKSFKNMFS